MVGGSDRMMVGYKYNPLAASKPFHAKGLFVLKDFSNKYNPLAAKLYNPLAASKPFHAKGLPQQGLLWEWLPKHLMLTWCVRFDYDWRGNFCEPSCFELR